MSLVVSRPSSVEERFRDAFAETDLVANSSGVVKIVFALIFPSGITLCVLVGGDLVTSNLGAQSFDGDYFENLLRSAGIMLVAVMGRTIPWWAYITNVLVVTVGNFAGSLIIAGLFGKVSRTIFSPWHLLRLALSYPSLDATRHSLLY